MLTAHARRDHPAIFSRYLTVVAADERVIVVGLCGLKALTCARSSRYDRRIARS